MAGRKKRGEASDTISLSIGGGGRGRKAVGELVDSHKALPGAIKQVTNQAKPPVETDSVREMRERYARYLLYLEDPREGNECFGDPIGALMKAWNLADRAAAEVQFHELHDRMTSASKGLSVAEIMRRYDLNPEARIRILARHARSLDPRISMVAIKEANDLDEQLKAAGGGATFEDWVATVLFG